MNNASEVSRLALRTALLPMGVVVFALAGAALHAAGHGAPWGDDVWIAGLVITGAPVVWHTLRRIVSGHFATDIVAMLAIVTAVAMQEPLAGLIVVLMQTGGEALERFAEGRASQAVRALEAQAPRIAHRRDGARYADIPVDEVRVGDAVLVRARRTSVNQPRASANSRGLTIRTSGIAVSSTVNGTATSSPGRRPPRAPGP